MNDGQNASATEQTSAPTMADIASSIQPGDTGASAPSGETRTEQSQNGQQGSSDNVTEFQKFISETTKVNQELKSEVEQLKQTQDEFVNSQHREAVNKEIDSVVEKINSEVGSDSEMARLWLESQYGKDSNLQKVWDNRADNPEALEKAVNILKGEWAAKNKNFIDPQVAENQRALRESQRSGGTVQETDTDTRLANLSEAEFMREMQQLQG